MNTLQFTFIAGFVILNFILSFKGFWETYKHKNAYGETPYLYPLGMYVWGDAMIFGVFFALSGIVTLLLTDWVLFWLVISLSRMVRSIGETIFWFNQQFSTVVRYEPKRYWTHKIAHNDSIWFIFQIMNQCVTVVTIITSLYLARLWLISLS